MPYSATSPTHDRATIMTTIMVADMASASQSSGLTRPRPAAGWCGLRGAGHWREKAPSAPKRLWLDRQSSADFGRVHVLDLDADLRQFV
jgi:hypothetical protein